VATKKILITGATGQVARPIAESLAADAENEVWCLGRFGDAGVRAALERLGITTWGWDMGRDDLDGLPDDFTHVLHAAALRDTDDFDAAMRVNVVGTGRLMTHCRSARAFLFVSAFAVYKYVDSEHCYAETDALGGHTPWMPAYAPSKIATEGVVRAFADTLGLPTVIARLNTAYGPYGHGGVPIRFFKLMLSDQPIAIPKGFMDWSSPIHTDDLARQVPLLWDRAAVEPLIVNWAGDEPLSVVEMMESIAELTGVKVKFEATDMTRSSFLSDNTYRQSLIGECHVRWADGIPRVLNSHFPGSVAALPAPSSNEHVRNE
jgi:nucleoside-diphosphate-sugar epimerase